MKKRLSLFLVLCLLLSVAICPAYALPGINAIPFSATQLGQEQYMQPDGIMRSVQPFQLSVPCDGEYHDIWEGEFRAGSVVEFNGTWSPAYARLTIEIIKDDGGYGTMTTITSGGSGSLRIRQAGSYIIHVKAEDRDITGTLSMDL